MTEKNKKRFYKLIIFSLVLLFNPNINIVDLLPDFIAWFILAKLFEKAADSAAYFEEARCAFVKLGFVNLLKLPALILIILIKGKNTLDNDVFALAAFSFGVIEAILSVNAAKQLFAAFFHLGERTDAKAFISPIKAPIFTYRMLSCESIKEYTYFFFICKAFLSFLPSLFVLTRISESGQLLSVSKHYPIVLLLAQIIGLFIGIVFILRTRKYAKAIHEEGKFEEAVLSLAREGTMEKYEAKRKIRKISLSLTLLCISSFFALELVFDNYNGINILPHFLYGILLVSTLLLFARHTKPSYPSFILGGVFIILSVVAYILSVSFLSTYEYSDILSLQEAKQSYILVLLFSALEFLALIAFLILTALYLRRFIFENTGCDTSSVKYTFSEKGYHDELIKKSYVMTALAIISGLTKCIQVFLKFNVKFLMTDISGEFEPTIVSSPLPWFNIVVIAASILYIGYTVYFTSYLKEEVKMKYII